MSPELRARRTRAVLATLAVLAILAGIAFMTLGARGSWSFVLSFRGAKLLTLSLVAIAIATSTVIFQTVVNNRVLTPSIMGFDALYVLIQTLLVYFIGAAATSALDQYAMFFAEIAIMTAFAAILYGWLFSGGIRSIHLMMLVGIVFGILFRGLADFFKRIIDPGEFVVLQDRLFASFNIVDTSLLWIGGAMIVLLCGVVVRLLPVLDVLALGREAATSLGIEYRRMVMLSLVVVTLLVAVSTALVGPVTFLGLLVANLAYLLLPTARHAAVLPAACLISFITLVGGQTILERVFGFDTALSIVVEFIGGIVFILLVIRGSAR